MIISNRFSVSLAPSSVVSACRRQICLLLRVLSKRILYIGMQITKYDVVRHRFVYIFVSRCVCDKVARNVMGGADACRGLCCCYRSCYGISCFSFAHFEFGNRTNCSSHSAVQTNVGLIRNAKSSQRNKKSDWKFTIFMLQSALLLPHFHVFCLDHLPFSAM